MTVAVNSGDKHAWFVEEILIYCCCENENLNRQITMRQ